MRFTPQQNILWVRLNLNGRWTLGMSLKELMLTDPSQKSPYWTSLAKDMVLPNSSRGIIYNEPDHIYYFQFSSLYVLKTYIPEHPYFFSQIKQ
jgi:hypothetical protein